MRRLFLILLVAGLMISLLGNGLAFAKDKENFRIKFLWQPGEVVGQVPFSLSDYSLSENWNPRDYFGDWGAYGWGDDIDFGWLGTFTELDYKAGDSVPLRQMRRVSTNRIGRHFGVEAEIRVAEFRIGEIWFGGSYVQSPVFTIDSIEEGEEMVFEEFKELSKYYAWNGLYYGYHMKLDRFSTVQKISERFYSRNFQLYAKGEIESGRFSMFSGIGLDIWQMNREVKVDKTVYSLMPWSGKSFDEKEVSEDPETDTKWYLRPFVLTGVQVFLVKRLSLGVQTKFFFGDKEFDYPVDSLLPVPEKLSYRAMKFSESSIALYLSFGF